METFFDKSIQEQFQKRIETLSAQAGCHWGKMNAAQMLAHCTAAFQLPAGDLVIANHPLRFLGSLLKRPVLGGKKPFSKNSPTAREFVMSHDCDFEAEKQKLLAAFQKMAEGPSAIKCFQHPFFGKMTIDDWGRLIYKHLDHHLRQFGV